MSLPLKAYQQVPPEPLTGKVVLDTNNYYPERDGHIAELDNESTTTTELLQAHLPPSHVVKAFNTVFFKHLAPLARARGAKDRSAIPIAGTEAAAKETVTSLLDDLGYDAYDAGKLPEGWRFQRDTIPYAYSAEGSFETPAPADTARLKVLFASAKRYHDM